jgi:2-polyprenyl-3-methyl-5-hydroxy-6-metoxy-1,4-benzoquinol methylase
MSHGNRQKHESRNPAQRLAIANFHRQVCSLVRRASPQDLLDAGCGEGFTLAAIRDAGISTDLYGVDLDRDAIELARIRLGEWASVRVADARALDPRDRQYDLVMMLEVLEHLHEPEAMLDQLAGLSRRYVLLSVPHEPWFRGLNLIRGKNVRRLGNDPEHVQHWRRRRFVRWIGTRFRVLDAPVAFPWTLVLAEHRD